MQLLNGLFKTEPEEVYILIIRENIDLQYERILWNSTLFFKGNKPLMCMM